MIRLVNLAQYKKQDRFQSLLNDVNSIRSHYPWSERVYTASDIDNLYLVRRAEVFVGFIECTYRDLDITLAAKPFLFLHELHIVPRVQKQGVGQDVLKFLLRKGVPIQMVVANQNVGMLRLLSKFETADAAAGENVSFIWVHP
jgi:ribosomal protein S18 acetylase RimI-like enzyme